MTFGVSMGPDASPARWASEHRFIKRGTGSLFRKLQSIHFLVTRDRHAVAKFLRASYPFDFPVVERMRMLQRFIRTTNALRGYHTLSEILAVCDHIFRLGKRPGLTVVEAGSGSGSSTAKLSLATQIAGGRLLVFDSFRGIPANDEKHELLDGRSLQFKRGAFRGRLSAVVKHVEDLGAIEVCTFYKGLFAETLPKFDGEVDVVLLDVDLLSSTRECTAHFFPRLRSGGVICSQDGHLRATVELYRDPAFWRSLGVAEPVIAGLGVDKFLELRR